MLLTARHSLLAWKRQKRHIPLVKKLTTTTKHCIFTYSSVATDVYTDIHTYNLSIAQVLHCHSLIAPHT